MLDLKNETAVLTAEPTTNKRIHYMDHVRAFAMLLGVFFHAGFAYAEYTQAVWFVTDNSSSFLMEGFIWFSHLFRMAVFFLIAGFFANLLVKKRGVKGFLKNRALRIGLPFILFVIPSGIAVILLLVYATEYLTQLNAIQQIVADAIKNNTPDPNPPSTGVLWFLYNLMYFCVFAAILQSVNWGLVDRIRNWFFSSVTPLLYVPLALVPGLYYAGLPLGAPDSFLPQLWSYGYYGVFFLIGWHFFYRTDYLDLVSLHLNKLIAFSVIAYPAFFYLMPEATLTPAWSISFSDRMAFDAQKLAAVVLEAYLSVYLTLVALVFGRRFFDVENRLVRYISDASYWVYLVHLPLVFYFQIILTEVDMNVWVKYAITTGATLGVAFLTYAIGVRYTPIGWMLNGRKSRKNTLITAEQH